jgi:hypothetical protein
MPTHATVGGGFNDAAMDRLAGPDSRLDLSIRTTTHVSNPPFVFPAAPAPIAPRTTARRPLSAIESPTNTAPDISGFSARRSSAAPLPEFSFNPGAGMKQNPFPFGPFPPAQQHRPSQPSQSASRPPGGFRHRRGGSEFVGGSIRMGDSIQVTNTPAKGDGTQTASGFLPPPNRRHSRNRSANPSVGSVMLALQPVDGNAKSRGTSAPVSPADVVGTENFFPAKAQVLTPPSIDVSPAPTEAPVATEPVAERDNSNDMLSLKTRVGFSEAVEYIPRPVSLISSDTSSTATVRPSHSLTGSVSSLVSMGNTALERGTPPPLSRTTTLERTESRPSTAGAVLDRALGSLAEQSADSLAKRRNSIPVLITIPSTTAQASSESSPSKTPKRWSFFGLEPFSNSGSPTRSRPTSSSSPTTAPSMSPGGASVDSSVGDRNNASDDSAAEGQARQAGKPKKKKVKKWAGAILTRKAKPRAHKSCENLRTHPPSIMDPMPQLVIGVTVPALTIDPPMPVLTVTEPTTSPYDVEVSRPVSAPSPDDDSSYGVIDLDVALGPFNTPLPRNPEWDAAQKAASQAKRPLHSAQGMKGFSGPGMHYHRRTESAPEMAPIEGLRGGLHRFGSRSTMADVFEEDEEDEKNDSSPSEATTSRGNLSETPRASLPDTMSSMDSESDTDGDMTPPALADPTVPQLDTLQPFKAGHEQSTLHVPPPVAPITLRKERSTPTLRQDTTELAGPITFRTGNLFMDKADSGDLMPRRARDLAPVDISPLHTPPGHQAPASPYTNSNASSYPSPRSQLSYDAQIISTAPSSVNEETTFQSLLLGEPGPEVRISVDDVPSLCSGTSITTRDSVVMQNGGLVQTPNSDHPRPTSFGGEPIPRRRSSVLSFARLISSSHGERSKLSVEVSMNDDDEEQKPKVSRTRRLSRLMQFWKPKEAKERK